MTSQQLAARARDELVTGYRSLSSQRDEILYLIGWATLAPSTHNTQPWRFEVDGSHVSISFDRRRSVPEADPEMRDMALSMGALLRHIELVGERVGCIQDLTTNPDLDLGRLATFTFASTDQWADFVASDLGQAILHRQNYRGDYADTAIERSKIAEIASEVAQALAVGTATTRDAADFYVIDGADDRPQTLFRLTAEGIAEAYKSKGFRREVARHINSNYSTRSIGLHGYSLTMGNFTSLALPHIMKHVNIGAKLSKLNLRRSLSYESRSCRSYL